MNGAAEEPSMPEGGPGEQKQGRAEEPERGPFFGRTDWRSFWITGGCALALYLATLAPEVTLESSGILSTGAMYGGGAPPPGYPLWTLYGWLFTKLLPFSNIAWRVAVSSAVAGAVACGLIGLMVSRGSVMILEGLPAGRRLPEQEEVWLRFVCGFVAGMGFAAHGIFWGQAVIVESMALGVAMFAVALCLLFRWLYAPEKMRYFYGAVFIYGLALTVRFSLAVAAPGLLCLVLFREAALGRDLLFAVALVWGTAWVVYAFGVLPDYLARPSQFAGLSVVYLWLGIISGMVCLILILKTGRLLTRWGALFVTVLMLALGLSLYGYVALASMTNPPTNWGYARTVEGFLHTISRGQFEGIHGTDSLGRFIKQIGLYAKESVHELGFLYLVPALFPFFFLRKMKMDGRIWMLGLLATFSGLSLLLLALANPTFDRASVDVVMLVFPPSHLVLAVWAGYGLALIGTLVGGAGPCKSQADLPAPTHAA